MPIHDWSRVPAGLFHDFRQDWSVEITRTLNRGRLPKGLSALVEQRAGPKESDVLAIEVRPERCAGEEVDGGVATMPPPVTRIVRRTTKEIYASRANRIVVKHHLGRIIAVIEIVSPGNKDSRAAIRDFVEKTVDCLRKGIHVLIVDLFLRTTCTSWSRLNRPIRRPGTPVRKSSSRSKREWCRNPKPSERAGPGRRRVGHGLGEDDLPLAGPLAAFALLASSRYVAEPDGTSPTVTAQPNAVGIV